MTFRLGNEKRRIRNSKDTPIIKKKLDKGVMAEANMDGSIFVDHKVDLNSKEGRKTIAHEMQHIKDMKSGKAAYGDDYVRWKGETYARDNGDIIYKGKKYPEGSSELPWEQEAEKAEENVT